jgi:elongation of very long chain fatty acids protein 6
LQIFLEKTGLWFAAMNFTVHSIMYTYYFMMAIGMRSLAKPFAPLVTTLQVMQQKFIVITVIGAEAFSHSLMHLSFHLSLSSLQLLQMVVGMVVTVTASYKKFTDASTCNIDSANLKLGLAMYFSYFILFAILFHNLYIKPTPRKIQTGCPDLASSLNVSDASGFFHDNSKPEETKKSN